MFKSLLRPALAAALVLAAASQAVAQNRLVNLIPNNRSGETNQDAEPTIAVDPNDFTRLTGSAFTWDNLNQGPMVTATAPIYVSSDRGATWTLSFIVPSSVGSGFPTGDINPNYSSILSGSLAHTTSWLYTGTLSATSAAFPMTVLRSQDPFGTTVMTTLDTRTGNVDQPHVKALTSFWNVQDKLYVGFNNGFGCLSAPNGRSSTIDVSQDGKIAAPAFALNAINTRNSACQDGFAQVPAIHLDGTVYAAFIYNWSGSANQPRIVVVRDDNFGTGATPFSALTDPSDGLAGRFVTNTLILQHGTMGQQRLGASNLSIAVDPRDSDRVYVAWGDAGTGGGSNTETIHVRRSTDRGATWSGSDLLNVTNAMNPQVAINTTGTVGVLYQRLNASRWETHFVNTTDADATVFNTPGLLLANQSATSPVGTIASNVYLGDYASLVAAGKNFIGMFSTSNFPDTANFMAGVQFQREVNWATHQLFTDATHTTTTPVSIDPFFFEVSPVSTANDFYVRDWTTDGTHADNGVEPSTNTNFYSTSDVWNRRGTTPGPFVNDQPSNEDAGNGAGNIGDNWAYVRVRRNAAGSAQTVNAHFLVSRFGTGSNYVDSTSGDPNVTFLDPDPVPVATDATVGPWISTPYHWHLNPTGGNHLCLAVEIGTATDPFVAPSLVGQTPGWSTGTDLRIVSDNNKAQRNMHLSTTPASGGVGSVTEWAVVHNPSTFKRDIPLRVSVDGTSKRYVRNINVLAPGERQSTFKAQDGTGFVLHGVQPGENRWVAVTVQAEGMPVGGAAVVNVDELTNGNPTSGFAVGVRSGQLRDAMSDSLFAQRVVLTRLQAFYARKGDDETEKEEDYKAAAQSPERFLNFVQLHTLRRIREGMERIDMRGTGDPFGLRPALTAVSNEKTAEGVIAPLATLLNALDAQLTQIQLRDGDPADILQMVRWQHELFRRQPALSKLSCAKDLVASSSDFLHARESRKLTNSAYPELLARQSQCLLDGVKASGGRLPNNRPFQSTDLAALEKEHRAILLQLAR